MDGFRDVRLVGFTTLNEGILVTLACLALPLKNPINAGGRAEGLIQCPQQRPFMLFCLPTMRTYNIQQIPPIEATILATKLTLQRYFDLWNQAK